MRYAWVAGQRVEARPHMKGVCRRCDEPVIAKCGERRVWHWAHLGESTCGGEPETDWHRGWKDRFPNCWQEMIAYAPNGEKHVADVKTPHGLVIEFQHSFLDPKERLAREAFYRNMIWVVDGTRNKRDKKRFFDAIAQWRKLSPDIFITPFVEEALPVEWVNSSVPVCFDFGEPRVWCLLPKRSERYAVVVAMAKDEFVRVFKEEAGYARLLEGKAVIRHEASPRLPSQRWRYRRRRYARF